MTCAICDHADRHGDWGPGHQGRTHCRRCHGSWPMGTNIQHCVGCCRSFTNIRAADIHRDSHGCQDPATIHDRDGRRRLVVSTRHRGSGTTVKIWALAEHRESRHALRVPRLSAPEPLASGTCGPGSQSGLTQASGRPS